MEKICTTIGQSKKLIEIGIDVRTADMYYQYYKSYSSSGEITEGHCDIPLIGSWKEHHISIPDPTMPHADIPAWSLSALLELMPEIHSERPKLDTGRIQTDKYYVEYPYHERTKKDWHSTELYDEPLDAAFEMVVWLKETGKI